MTRVVLGFEVTRDLFQDFAIGQGWHLRQVVDQSDNAPYEEVWRAKDDTFVVHYIEDDMLDVSYALCAGEGRQTAIDKIVQQLTTVPIAVAFDRLRTASSGDDRERAVAMIAAAADPNVEDEQIRQALRQALFDVDPEVRRTALFASAYVSWPSLDESLAAVHEKDPDPEIRQDALRTMTAIARHRT